MSEHPDKQGDERREYFRVNDAVRLNIRAVPDNELDDLLSRLEQNITSTFTVMSSLAAISAEMAVSMRRIGVRSAACMARISSASGDDSMMS